MSLPSTCNPDLFQQDVRSNDEPGCTDIDDAPPLDFSAVFRRRFHGLNHRPSELQSRRLHDVAWTRAPAMGEAECFVARSLAPVSDRGRCQLYRPASGRSAPSHPCMVFIVRSHPCRTVVDMSSIWKIICGVSEYCIARAALEPPQKQ